MTVDFILLYAFTVFVACIIPGPTALLAVNHGMRFGVRLSLATALGYLAVTLAQALISIGGLGAVLMASEIAFRVIRWAGAAFLVYLGLGLLRAPGMPVAEPLGRRDDPRPAPLKMFAQGALVTGSNPKIIVFFTAVFPQFIDPAADLVPQTVVLLVTGLAVSFVCFMLYAVAGRQVFGLWGQGRAGRYLNRGMGASFIGAAIGLALKNR